MRKYVLPFVVFTLFTLSLPGQDTFDRKSLSDEIESSMLKACVDSWYPGCIDEESGGFITNFDATWQQQQRQNKMIVSQARLIWTAAILAEFYPEKKDTYLSYAQHGFEFLRDKMWDEEFGGFYQMVDREGNPIGADDELGQIKTAYGNAFGIYGLSAYARASKNEEVLEFVKKAFMWLENHSHDPKAGGYFQFLLQDGTPMEEGHTAPPKDQNSSIHLLEAFTELYQVWPVETVRQRVEEMLLLIRDVIVVEPGYLTLFSNADWSPVSYRDSSDKAREMHHHLDHVSFGHDIETAYLLMEASHIIDHNEGEKTAKMGKQMVDHTLNKGWDMEDGGIYDAGYYFKDRDQITITKSEKAWWAQVEAMNTLLIMHDMYPEDPLEYGTYFTKQWDYIKKYLIDTEHPGIYTSGIDEQPRAKMAPKGGIWKVNYHNVRSFLNCIKRLRHPSTH